MSNSTMCPKTKLLNDQLMSCYHVAVQKLQNPNLSESERRLLEQEKKSLDDQITKLWIEVSARTLKRA